MSPPPTGANSGVGSPTVLLGRTSEQVIFPSELSLLTYQIGSGNLLVALSIPMAAARANQDCFEIGATVGTDICPSGLSSVDPLPSSPAQEALDLLFSCDSTEEASSSLARGPLSEAELALFDPYSKEGKEQVWGSGTKGCEGRPSVAVSSSGRSPGGWSWRMEGVLLSGQTLGSISP